MHLLDGAVAELSQAPLPAHRVAVARAERLEIGFSGLDRRRANSFFSDRRGAFDSSSTTLKGQQAYGFSAHRLVYGLCHHSFDRGRSGVGGVRGRRRVQGMGMGMGGSEICGCLGFEPAARQTRNQRATHGTRVTSSNSQSEHTSRHCRCCRTCLCTPSS